MGVRAILAKARTADVDDLVMVGTWLGLLLGTGATARSRAVAATTLLAKF